MVIRGSTRGTPVSLLWYLRLVDRLWRDATSAGVRLNASKPEPNPEGTPAPPWRTIPRTRVWDHAATLRWLVLGRSLRLRAHPVVVAPPAANTHPLRDAAQR